MSDNLKQCKVCVFFKSLDQFYSQKRVSKTKGEYYYYDPVCKECRVERQTNHNIANAEDISEYKKVWYEPNKEKVSNMRKERYKNNNIEAANYLREWHKENRNKTKMYNLSRRKLKTFEVSEEEWFYCCCYFNNSCAYCGLTWEQHMETLKKGLSKEHFRDDGGNDLSNCIPSCTKCNSQKGSNKFEDWYNERNEKFDIVRMYKIYNWINSDYKRFINK